MNIFNNSDIGSIPLIRYAGLFLNKDDEDYNLIQLPPIQRNAVWQVKQIERLWDSIMRGFPIGSFLLSNREKGSISRGITEKEQVVSENSGFFLLDGQQRTRAILLGFNHGENARLWIDLKPTLLFDNIEYNDRHFLFRVTTTHQPWGMKRSKPEDKLSEFQKNNAREMLYQKSLRYDYQVKINIPAHNGEPVSWPIEANLPIPFDALVELCGGYTGYFREPQWKEITPLIPINIKQDEEINEPEHFSEIITALKRILDNSNENEYKRSVALLMHNGDFQTKNENEQESIEVLFRRINSEGTILYGEEMQYSLLKATWDRAYDMVSNIINDDKIGYIFSSTGIVLSAARLARYNINEPDDSSPNVTKFRKWIGDKKQGAEKSFLDEMKGLLEVNPDLNKSIYHSVIEEFCNLVVFNGDVANDIGIPKKLLLSINSKYYHPVIVWIYLNRSNQLKIKKNRMSILRYLMFSLIGFDDANKVSKEANDIIKNNGSEGDFPDREIHQQCIKKEIAIFIPSNSNFNSTITNGYVDGFFRYWDELVEKDTANFKFREFRNRFWEKKALLLWFQRKHHHKWFQGYNPMSNDSSDTPYDYDHILPYSHLIAQGGNPKVDSDNDAMVKKFSDCRWRYINSIGNFRVWPSWANRSDQNDCHTKKLRLTKIEPDSLGQELDLKSADDFMRASAINIEDKALWIKAGGSPRNWNEERRINWQTAVESRVIFLYEIFYNSFDFECWIRDQE